MLFPTIVICLLAGHMAICVFAITCAVGGQGYAVVPDYYEKAVHWDDEQALLRASQALGWSAAVQLDAHADALGHRTITITLRDREGRPISDAAIEARFFHLAHAGNQQTLILPHTDKGIYTAVAPMPNDGLWELDLRVTRGNDVFVSTQVIDTAE